MSFGKLLVEWTLYFNQTISCFFCSLTKGGSIISLFVQTDPCLQSSPWDSPPLCGGGTCALLPNCPTLRGCAEEGLFAEASCCRLATSSPLFPNGGPASALLGKGADPALAHPWLRQKSCAWMACTAVRHVPQRCATNM